MEPGDWIVIEPRDVQAIYPDEATSDPWVWTALLWGGRRDLELIRRLERRSTKKSALRLVNQTAMSDDLTRLDQLDAGFLRTRKGIVRGDRSRPIPEIVGRSVLEAPEFPPGTFLRLCADALPLNHDPGIDRSDGTSLEPFELPQLIVKKAWSAESKRFSAALIDGDPAAGGVICTQADVTVHLPEAWQHFLEAACLSLNSEVAVYYLFLTSGQSASLIPSALVEELLSVPLPLPTPELLAGLSTFADVDVRARNVFGLNEAEWILIDDFMAHTLPQIQDAGSGGWRTSVEKAVDGSDEDLVGYCESFLHVLRDGMGARAGAAVFRGQTPDALPVHLIAIYLAHPAPPPVKVEPIHDDDLIERLCALDRLFLQKHPPGAGGVFFQRTARIYDTAVIDGVRVPVVYVVKPRAQRYWTRATALRDADEVVVDAALWADAMDREGEEHERDA